MTKVPAESGRLVTEPYLDGLIALRWSPLHQSQSQHLERYNGDAPYLPERAHTMQRLHGQDVGQKARIDPEIGGY